MHNSFCFCGVPLPDLVYAKLKSKEELERFPFTERGRDWTPERSETVLAHDGVEYQHRFHVKSLEMKDGDNTKPFEGVFDGLNTLSRNLWLVSESRYCQHERASH